MRPRFPVWLLQLAAAVGASATGVAAWPQLHGNAAHDGWVEADVRPPFRLAWVREFVGERLGTAMEPIVKDGLVFAATHQGNLYALDAASGEPRWRFGAGGPFLHAPAAAGAMIPGPDRNGTNRSGWTNARLVVAASADDHVYALEAATGRLRWRVEARGGGFAAAPVIGKGRVVVGSRSGLFLGIDLATGEVRWQRTLPAPIRQTAAMDADRVFVTAEDLRVRSFAVADGKLLWESDALPGQSARDYYPVVARADGRTWVVVRTNPSLNMAQRIARDRGVLAGEAGIDDGDWRKIDAWIKSDQAPGTPELRAGEQRAVAEHLEREPDARSFFVLDAETGRERAKPPVLWVGGCQGVPAPPARTADGRLLVLYRSAYGNWNHGVAPLVALGLLDLGRNSVQPLLHGQGRQPPWNTFWGTADECQNFTVAGSTVLIAHQGTLSGFNLATTNLFAVHGERDTFGGLRSPSWARNEWHGPARGAAAVDGRRIYWMTGSRLFCLAAGESGPAAAVSAVRSEEVPTSDGLPVPFAAPAEDQLRQWLGEGVEAFLSRTWAPLCVEPGLAGREFEFDQSGVAFETLAWAYPHLAAPLRERVRGWLRTELTAHLPVERAAWYSLAEGERREWHRVPREELSRLGSDRPPHPFGNLGALVLCGRRAELEAEVRALWPRIRASSEEFLKSGWSLDAARGDVYANRYLDACLALPALAVACGDPGLAARAQARADEITRGLVAWWKRAGAMPAPASFKGSAELDPFIGAGDAFSLRLTPHRHKPGLFHGLTPDVAERVRREAPEAVEAVWSRFATLHATWFLVGEERQVHCGENFIDPPDLAMDAFRALAWLRDADGGELARRVDLPFCRADLYYLLKLALTLERGGRAHGEGQGRAGIPPR